MRTITTSARSRHGDRTSKYSSRSLASLSTSTTISSISSISSRVGTPKPMEIILQTCYGLVIRGFLHVLRLNRTKTGGAMLGLAEALIMHGEVRAPRRSGRAAYDAWEVDAYVGIIFRLTIDLFFDGVKTAAIVAMWTGVGIVLLNVFENVFMSDAEPRDRSRSRSREYARERERSSYRRRSSPVRRESSRSRRYTEVAPTTPASTTRPDISSWTASIPGPMTSSDPEQPRTPPTTIAQTPASTRGNMTGVTTDVSVMHLTEPEEEEESEISSIYESAIQPQVRMYTQAGTGIPITVSAVRGMHAPPPASAQSAYESAYAPASTVRMLRPRHAIPTPDPSDFSHNDDDRYDNDRHRFNTNSNYYDHDHDTMSSLLSRPLEGTLNTESSPIDIRRRTSQPSRSLNSEDAVQRMESPPPRALMDPELPDPASVPDPTSPPRLKPSSPEPVTPLAMPLPPPPGPPMPVAEVPSSSRPSLSKRGSKASQSALNQHARSEAAFSAVAPSDASHARTAPPLSRRQSSRASQPALRNSRSAQISPEPRSPPPPAVIPMSPPLPPMTPLIALPETVSSAPAVTEAETLAPSDQDLKPKDTAGSVLTHVTSNGSIHESENENASRPTTPKAQSRPLILHAISGMSAVTEAYIPPTPAAVPAPASATPTPPASTLGLTSMTPPMTAIPLNPKVAPSPAPSPTPESVSSAALHTAEDKTPVPSGDEAGLESYSYKPPTPTPPPAVTPMAMPTPKAAVAPTPLPALSPMPVIAPTLAPAPASAPAPMSRTRSNASMRTKASERTAAVVAKAAGGTGAGPEIAEQSHQTDSDVPQAPRLSRRPSAQRMQSTQKASDWTQSQAQSSRGATGSGAGAGIGLGTGIAEESHQTDSDAPQAPRLSRRPSAQPMPSAKSVKSVKSTKSLKSEVKKKAEGADHFAQPVADVRAPVTSAPVVPAPAPAASSRFSLLGSLASVVGGVNATAPKPHSTAAVSAEKHNGDRPVISRTKSKSKAPSKAVAKSKHDGLSSDEDTGAMPGSGSNSDVVDSGMEEFSLTSPSVVSSRSGDEPSAPARSLGGAASSLMTPALASSKGKTKTLGAAKTTAPTPTGIPHASPPSTASAQASSPASGRKQNRRKSASAAADEPSTNQTADNAPLTHVHDSTHDESDFQSASERLPNTLLTVPRRALQGPQPKRPSFASAASSKRQSPLTSSVVTPARAAKMERVSSLTSEGTTTTATSALSTHDRAALLQHAELIRAKARLEESLRFKIEEDRQRAIAQGRNWEALRLKVRKEEVRRKAERLHKRAARRFEHAHNMRQQQPHVIDIHGLKVTEARARVEHALGEAMDAGASRLRVITGRGNHSVDNIPVLKTRILEAMAEYHIPTKVHPTNPGEIWIELSAGPPAVGTPS